MALFQDAYYMYIPTKILIQRHHSGFLQLQINRGLHSWLKYYLSSHLTRSLELGQFQVFLIQRLSDIIPRFFKPSLFFSWSIILSFSACGLDVDLRLVPASPPHIAVSRDRKGKLLHKSAASLLLPRVESHDPDQSSHQPRGNKTTIHYISSFRIHCWTGEVLSLL